MARESREHNQRIADEIGHLPGQPESPKPTVVRRVKDNELFGMMGIGEA